MSLNNGNANILIVDDEALIREVLVAALESEGFYTTSAESGEEALEKYKKFPFDVVITDISMPKLSGIDLLFELKKINEDVEVILITGYASLDTAEAAITGGAYRYLRKPFNDIDEVLDIVKNAIEDRNKRLNKDSKLEEAKYKIERLEKKVGDLETLYLISKKTNFADDPKKLILDVTSILSKVIPLNLLLCSIEGKEREEILLVLVKNIEENILNDFLLKFTEKGCKLLKQGPIKKDYNVNKIGKLVEIRFPIQSSIKGHILIALPESKKITNSQEQMLEITAAQVSAALAKLKDFSAKEHQRIKKIIGKIDEGVIFFDEKENIVMANKVAFKFFGLKNLSELKDEIDKTPLNNIKNVNLTLGKEIKFGDKVVSLNLFPLNTPWESYKIMVFKDMTQQLRIQKELERNRRLSTIGELLSGIVHELNNPITVILGYSQLLMGQRIPPNLGEDISIIVQESQRCQKIIQSLLTLGRAKTPKKILTEIKDVIEKVLELKQYDFKKMNIKINYKPPKGSMLVEMDPGEIEQVIINLVNNSQYAMETINFKKRELLINIERDSRYVKINLGDSGVGIPEDIIERIFDPFFTTKEPGKGSGLGLSISYKIIKEHQGEIYAKNKEDGGANFILKLPLSINKEEKKVYFSGLIISQNQEMIQMLSHFLKKYRVNSQAAMNSNTSNKMLGKNEYEIIVLEYEENFFEDKFIFELAKKFKDSTIVICEMTIPTKIREIFEANNIDFLIKPFCFSNMEKFIKKILAKNDTE